MTKRKQGRLLPLEAQLLAIACRRGRTKDPEFHGFAAARELDDATRGDGPHHTSNGGVYKALARLVDFGLLESTWEDPDAAVAEGRPRRRLYRITEAGDDATLPALLGARALGRQRRSAAARSRSR